MSVDAPSFVEQARRDKLAALRERGINPYGYRFERTHSAAQAVAAYDPNARVTVRVAGRLVSLRGMGKTTFGHVADGVNRVQVYFRRDDLGPEAYDVVKLLDLGDYIGVQGYMFQTRSGEVTVHVEELELLTKALRPLPLGKEDASGDLHGGLADSELRYRQRYADLAVHPDVRAVFVLRARIIAAFRRYLDAEGFVEVETPVLQPLYGGALARPFVTHYNALDTDFYLRIATELYLKRCIVGGLERVYEIGKDFRNEGIDRTHNPEFTMLEFYEAYADYADVMARTEEMLHAVVRDVCGDAVIQRFGTTFDFTPPWPRHRYADLVRDRTGLDLTTVTDAELRAALENRQVPDVPDMTRPKLVDEVFKGFVEPTLEQPTFVVDYPIDLSPLAKQKRGDPTLAERFELYIQGREIANAFSELNDPEEQRRRFEAQAQARAGGDEEAHQVDSDYVRALEYGMPPTGGFGLGVDRLVMLLAERDSIRDVLLFPMLRPES